MRSAARLFVKSVAQALEGAANRIDSGGVNNPVLRIEDWRRAQGDSELRIVERYRARMHLVVTGAANRPVEIHEISATRLQRERAGRQ